MFFDRTTDSGRHFLLCNFSWLLGDINAFVGFLEQHDCSQDQTIPSPYVVFVKNDANIIPGKGEL